MKKLGEINKGLEAPKVKLQAQVNNVEAYELIMKEVSISKKNFDSCFAIECISAKTLVEVITNCIRINHFFSWDKYL